MVEASTIRIRRLEDLRNAGGGVPLLEKEFPRRLDNPLPCVCRLI